MGPIDPFAASDDPQIVLGAATGPLMHEVIHHFRRSGIRVRVVSRVEADGDAAEARAALVGARTLILRGPSSARAAAAHDQVLAAARAAGVANVILVSAAFADGYATTPVADLHASAEASVRRSGMRFTILRVAPLLQHLRLQSRSIVGDGVLLGAMGTSRVAFVDARDVAAVAACVALDRGSRHSGHGYVLTGPKAIGHDELALLAGNALGRRVEHQGVDGETLHERLREGGAGDALAAEIVELQRTLAGGRGAYTTSAIASLLGGPARGAAQFLETMRRGER